jgi:hypothetical protein
MELAQRVASAKVDVRNRDMTIILSGPGTEPADFANMVALP